MDARAATDVCGSSVRRSRVVLTPRCWCQVVRGSSSHDDGGKRAVHRGELEVSRKAIAQGRPECFRRTCMLVCVFAVRNCTRDRGCGAHPVFPAPSDWRAGSYPANLGRVAPRERGVIFCIATTSTPSSLRTNAGTHSHRRVFCERRLPFCSIDRSRSMGPCVRTRWCGHLSHP